MNSNQTNNRILFAFMLACFSALGPFTIDMYLPAFPDLMTFFGTSASVVQVSLTACILGLAAGQIIIGALSDVHGRRRPLLIAMIIFGIASIGCAFAPNAIVFIVLRFIQGFAAAGGIVISRAIVRDTFSGVELAKFFTLLMMIGNAAPLLAPLAGSAVITFTDWTGVFMFLGIFAIILVIITTLKIKESLPKEKRVANDLAKMLINYKTLLTDRIFMGYALPAGIMFSGIFAYVSGSSFIYQIIYGVSPEVFSLLFSLNGISLIVGAQIARIFTGRISNIRLIIIGMSLALISSLIVLITTIVSGPLYALVIPLFLFMTSIGMVSPIFSALALESQGHIAGSASALMGVMPFLLGSITSPLVGIAGENSSLPLGIILVTTCTLSLLVYIVLVRTGTSNLPALDKKSSMKI